MNQLLSMKNKATKANKDQKDLIWKGKPFLIQNGNRKWLPRGDNPLSMENVSK